MKRYERRGEKDSYTDLRKRWRSLSSWMVYTGMVWKRRQPREMMRGSLDLRILGNHLRESPLNAAQKGRSK